jgi:hypothetical protein
MSMEKQEAQPEASTSKQRITRAERVRTRKVAARILQRTGMSRVEARAVVFGEGRRTRHETRRGALAQRVGVVAAAKRARKRRAAVHAAGAAAIEAAI